MRRSLAIVKSTALEVASEPLTLLVLLAALVLAIFAPAFHYHQFGDPTRMARDAGFSALLTCGGVIAVFGTIRAFRREIESGTLEMVLAHPISCTTFFLAKTTGVLLALTAFAVTVFGTLCLVFEGAAIGGVLAQKCGDVSRVYGPCLAGGIAILLLPLVVAAILNRFGRFRFSLTAFALALVLSLIGLAAMAVLSRGTIFRLVPVGVLILCPVTVMLAASAAFAVRFRANVAAACAGIAFAAILPAIGNYYLPDALSRGGSLPWAYVAAAVAAALPAVAAFLLLGSQWMNNRVNE